LQGHDVAIYRFGDDTPRIAASAWVADSAQVIGRVELDEGASLWYGVIARGDNDWIRVGRNANVQDGSVLHTDSGLPLTLGEGVSVGHQCMLHGCTVGANTLIGIQAVVLNRARIGRDSIVGACALVTEGKEFPDGSMILGSPAKVVRRLTAEEITFLGSLSAHYVDNIRRHRELLQRIG
jgi:carbonic anhydrase/acetyltransferase-like protein (isoleucine patch superfamily)